MRKLCILTLAAASLAANPPGSSDRELVARMSREHAGETPTPTGAAEASPGTAVRGSDVTYAGLDGKAVQGYLTQPQAEGAYPGIIVIHEWWGLNDNVRAMADRLAGEGYLALAVDLYEGGVASDRDGARSLMMASMSKTDRVKQNLRQAHAYLKAQGATRIGSIGWCFGGGWSLQAGLLLGGDLDATVIFYGRVVTAVEELASLEAAVLGLFGALDHGIPVASVREFEAALEEAGKNASIHIYENADHAFANPSGSRYNAEAAEDAWLKVTTFFEAHLGAGDSE